MNEGECTTSAPQPDTAAGSNTCCASRRTGLGRVLSEQWDTVGYVERKPRPKQSPVLVVMVDPVLVDSIDLREVPHQLFHVRIDPGHLRDERGKVDRDSH